MLLGIVYQHQRVISAIYKTLPEIKNSNSQAYQKNLLAIKKIRSRQFSPLNLLLCYAGIWFLLLAIEIVPWRWEAVLIGGAGPEIVGNVLLEFCFKRKRHVDNPDSSDNNNNSNREASAIQNIRKTNILVPAITPTSPTMTNDNEDIQNALFHQSTKRLTEKTSEAILPIPQQASTET